MRELAAKGRTVLVSSHLMSEMALTADHLLVIGKGQLIADTSVEEFVRSVPEGRPTASGNSALTVTNFAWPSTTSPRHCLPVG